MRSPPLDPPVSDVAPSDGVLTGYDEKHLVTYLRLLDAEAEGADWREVAQIVLHIDPAREPGGGRSPASARAAMEQLLSRASPWTQSIIFTARLLQEALTDTARSSS